MGKRFIVQVPMQRRSMRRVLLATTRSLVTLAESSGCDGEAVSTVGTMSDAPSSNVGRSTPRPRYVYPLADPGGTAGTRPSNGPDYFASMHNLF